MTVRHGGNNTPPTRLCQCGHTFHMHRGHCRARCDCERFTQAEQQASLSSLPNVRDPHFNSRRQR